MKYHNPDNLTPEQVGEGYRLLLKSEIKPRPKNKEIKAWIASLSRWTGCNDSVYEGSSRELTYRVPLATWPLPPEEPWTLGRSVNGFTLSEGQQWHRTDWTKDMLPEGWRPLLFGEDMGREDEFGDKYVIGHEGPTEWRNFPGMLGTSCHMRTRRPLPAPEIPWIPWHGGECPLKDEEVEEWEFKGIDGYQSHPVSRPSTYRWSHTGLGGDIIAYRVLKWKKEPAQEPTPTDNDAWECLLRTNADLGREVSELKKQRDALSSQLQGVITSCHLRGYNVGDPLGEWIEKQLEDAVANIIYVDDFTDQNGIPAFQQGGAQHEMQEVVTAKMCEGYVKRITELKTKLQAAEDKAIAYSLLNSPLC